MASPPSDPHPGRVNQKPSPAADSHTPWSTVLQRPWNWAVGRRYELAALVLYAFVLVVRAPWVLVLGRFWAEEATVYLAYAWNHSFLDALTAPHFGYFNLVANVGRPSLPRTFRSNPRRASPPVSPCSSNSFPPR